MAQASSKPRSSPAFECDHMRPVVHLDGSWRHITPEGTVGGECGAGIYEVEVTYEGAHTIDKLDRRKYADS